MARNDSASDLAHVTWLKRHAGTPLHHACHVSKGRLRGTAHVTIVDWAAYSGDACVSAGVGKRPPAPRAAICWRAKLHDTATGKTAMRFPPMHMPTDAPEEPAPPAGRPSHKVWSRALARSAGRHAWATKGHSKTVEDLYVSSHMSSHAYMCAVILVVPVPLSATMRASRTCGSRQA